MSDAVTPLPLAVDPRFQNRERQPGLDLLRALAIIVVVAYHAALFGFILPGRIDRFGWIGVDLFFVLSGYLIGGQLLAPLRRDQRVNLGRFFARRALRIMPAYFAVLAIYFLLPSWREYPEMSQPLWKFLLSIQNIALHGGTAFSHAWSLAVEDQFYLALPFLLLFLYRRPRTAIIIPRFPSMDLLSHLDPAGSARLRRCFGGDRKIPTAMVATAHELRDLALAA